MSELHKINKKQAFLAITCENTVKKDTFCTFKTI